MQEDAATRAITGELALVLLIAAPLAFVVSLFLLRLFLGAVQRSMMSSVGAHAAPASTTPSAMPAQVLGFADAGARPGEIFLGWPAAIAYLLGGLAYALAMGWVYLYANGLEFLPRRYAFMVLNYSWPTLIAIGLAAATEWRGWAVLVAAYIGFVLLAVQTMLGEMVTFTQLVIALLALNGPGALLLAFFLARPIRAVGPMTLVFMVAVVGGANLALSFGTANEVRLRWVVELGSALGMGGEQIFFALLAVGAVLMGLLGWVLLLGLGALYRARAITDQTLIVDAVFLFFALTYAMDFAFAGAAWFFSGFIAFGVYKLVSLAAFALIRARTPAAPPRLLLLRVFPVSCGGARAPSA